MAGPIRIAILANAIQARREMRSTANEGQRMGRALERVGKVGAAVRERMAGLAKGLLKVVGIAAQLASTFAAAAPALLHAGAAILNVAKAAGNVAPALAAIAAAAVFVKLTMTQIGPAIVKQLSPITKGFTNAGKAAGKLASAGLKPLGQQFVKVNLPGVARGMNTIARSTNDVVAGYLSWLASSRGVKALNAITGQTGKAVKRLSGPVFDLAVAFTAMVGRIAKVSLVAGSSGLTKVLDKVTEKLKGITAASVRKGFDDLKNAFVTIKGAVVAVAGAVKRITEIYKQFETQIKAVSDIFAVFAIAAALFGGPIGVAIFAAVGLIIRHFDEFKAAIGRVKDALKSDTAVSFMDGLKQIADQIFPALKKAFEDISAAVLPKLKEIGDTIRNDLVPAFGGFVLAMAPVVAFFITTLVPVITNALTTVLGVIKGVVQIITGIFTVFTGILHGDWSQVWEGIKQILSGAVTVIKALVTGLWNGIKAGFTAGKAIVSGVWNGLWALVKSAIGAAASAISGKLSQIKSAISSKFSDMKSAVADKMHDIVSSVRSRIQDVKSAITSIDLAAAGRKLIRGLISGIESMLGPLTGIADKVAGIFKGRFPGSPIKTGPLKSWNGGGAGKRLMKLLVTGIDSQTKSLATTSNIAASVVNGAFGGSPRTGTLPEWKGVGNVTININFTGVVGDPVEVGRQIDRVVTRYYKDIGRAQRIVHIF